MTNNQDNKKILVALDYDKETDILNLCSKLDPTLVRLKIGKQSFTRHGPSIIHKLHKDGFEIFLDLKFHDIPNTVYRSCLAAFELGIWMLNIHLLGGQDMILAAKQARDEVNKDAKLIGVSLLTSMSDKNLNDIGLDSRSILVDKLATIAQNCNIDGLVCSPGDIESISKTSKNFLYVTPGIRLSDSSQDHSKVYSPADALRLGATYLVIGRSITEAEDPSKVVKDILLTI